MILDYQKDHQTEKTRNMRCYLHSRCEQRECVSRYGNQERHEYLEIQAEGVKCWGNISGNRQRHEHSEEFSEVSDWL